jgi:general secretion pathway protein K
MHRNIKQKGIALVIVLWMLVLLMVMATGFSNTMRTETVLTANLVQTAQAKALAEAGIWHTVAELLKPRVEQTWKTDGSIYTFNFNQDKIRVSIQDEVGKIDLNTAHSELLYGLLKFIEIPEEDRLPLLQAIFDWRDRDHLVRNEGAEDDDYQRLEYDYGAKDGPFNSVDELQLVMGMTPLIFKQLRPVLTIYTHQPAIQPKVAPREALLAIPGITAERVDEIMAMRAALPDPQTPLNLTGIDSKYLSKAKGYIFTISSEGMQGDSYARLDVVVMIIGRTNLDQSFSILSWREDQTRDQEAPLFTPRARSS